MQIQEEGSYLIRQGSSLWGTSPDQTGSDLQHLEERSSSVNMILRDPRNADPDGPNPVRGSVQTNVSVSLKQLRAAICLLHYPQFIWGRHISHLMRPEPEGLIRPRYGYGSVPSSLSLYEPE